MRLTLESFGFDYDAPPVEAAWVADVRDIPATAIDGMEDRTGLDPTLQARIMETSAAQAWQRKFTFDALITLQDGELVAFGCAWGRHRSVAMVEVLAAELRLAGHVIDVVHRDIDQQEPPADREDDVEDDDPADDFEQLVRDGLALSATAARDTADTMDTMSNSTPPAAERRWYEIKNAAADVAEVYIYDQIGYDWWTDGGVQAKNFMGELNAITSPEIHLHINSPGGSVFDGVAIYNGLVRHKAKVTTFIDGLAASIASIIALAGERVVMAENALFMIHNPWGGVQGDAADMRKMADVLDKIRDTLVNTYEARTSMSRDELVALLDAETWYDAAEALAAGFVDEIAGAQRVAASFDLSQFPFRHAPKAQAVKDSGTGGAPATGTSGGAPEPRNTEAFIPGIGFARF